MFTGGNFASIAPRTRYVLSSELRLFQKGYLGHALFHPRPNLKGSSLRKLHTGAAPCRHQIIRKDQRGFAVKTHARVQPLEPTGGAPQAGGGIQGLLRGALRWALGVGVLAVASLAIAPSILSTRVGLQATLGLTNAVLPGTVRVEEASLGWGSPVMVRGISISEPKASGGNEVAGIRQISTNRPLWEVLSGRPYDLIVAEPKLDLTLNPDGDLRLEALLESWKVLQKTPSLGIWPEETPAAEPGPSTPAAGAQTASQKPQTTGPKSGKTRPALEAGPSAPLRFTAEGRVQSCQVYVVDGVAQVQEEISEMLGDDLHLTAVVGRQNLVSEADDFGMDVDWLEEMPEDIVGEPIVLLVNSENLHAEVSGWKTKDGMQLRVPAQATFDFTPALAKYALERVSPLLASVASMEQGEQVVMSFSPEGMHWPANFVKMRVEPMRLLIGHTEIMDRVMSFLDIRDSGKAPKLQAWTSRIEAVIWKQGPAVTERMDILFGLPSGRGEGVQVAMWGKVYPKSLGSGIDVTLGIASRSFQNAGVQTLPSDFVLAIPMQGTAQRPKVDWKAAYRRLASQYLQHRAAGVLDQRSGGILRELPFLKPHIDGAEGAPPTAADKTPPPSRPMPWEEE